MPVDLEAEDPFNVHGTTHGAVVGDVYIEATYDDEDRLQVVKIAALDDQLLARTLERIPWERTLKAWGFVRRGLRLGESFVGARTDTGGGNNARAAAREFRLASREVSGNKRPGRAGRPDEFYERIARRYADLVAAGDPRPNTTIADEMERSGDQVADAWGGATTVRGWVHNARKRGLLPSATPGRAG